MVKFRIPSLRSAAALLSAPGPAAQCTVSRDNKVVLNERESPVRLSTGPQQKHTTFYEFRTYSIKPHLVPSFLQLTNQKIHLRTAHSQLIGYWSVEYGGLNQVFHIWKYDSYSERAAVRAALSQDPSWVSDYISKAMPMLSSQENEVTYLVPWSRLQTPPQTGGVYELVSYLMRPGGPAVWGDAFQAAVTSHDAPGYGKLVGAFHSEFGLLNREYNLRRHHETRHKEYTSLRGQAREDRIRRMKGGLAAQQNVFLRQTQVNQAAVRANYKVAHLLATHGKLFTDGDLVKECMVAVAEEVCPDKKDALNVVSLSAPTMTRRIEDLGDNVYDQM
ncbi:protein NipSnap homolog 3A [Perca fluviatilis]|uniref:protein NipSnap homolog 3A n=1 Tax=Perca fluviatilis TaxID=8168 RepID=UPI001964088B|nr:protein NipSnap homolog 3A [Perca fluviatilis]